MSDGCGLSVISFRSILQHMGISERWTKSESQLKWLFTEVVDWLKLEFIAREQELSVFRFFSTTHNSLDGKTSTRIKVFSSDLAKGIGEIPEKRNFLV